MGNETAAGKPMLIEGDIDVIVTVDGTDTTLCHWTCRFLDYDNRKEPCERYLCRLFSEYPDFPENVHTNRFTSVKRADLCLEAFGK